MRDALGVPVTAALLKGRANYLCRHRLARTATEGRFTSRRQSADFQKLADWAQRTRHGDIAEMADIAEDSELWPLVTSTAENCLGGNCPDFGDCCVNSARREALAADVVVVNHHLFFADLALREEGFSQLLPGAEAVIFDEAHQLADIATVFFGQALSSHQLLGLCRDTTAEDVREHSGVGGLPEVVHKLEKSVADFRLVFGPQPRRDALSAFEDRKDFRAALADLAARLDAVARGAGARGGEGPGARQLPAARARTRRAAGADSRRVGHRLHRLVRDLGPRLQPVPDAARCLAAVPRASRRQRQGLGIRLGDARHQQKFFPLSVAARARHGRYRPVGEPVRLCQPDAAVSAAGPARAGAPDYTARVVEAALPVLRASRGRAFLLFTSYRALNLAELLRERLEYPLLVQGEVPRSVLLERFRAAGNAVLLGTSSFWEGVDVRGEALSCVIIDKLPFAAPDDPVLQARGRAMEEAGRNPFMEYQLPAAVIALKQGAGRLIRDERDHGVLMLCDPRLLKRGYGKTFLDSLPPMPRTRALADVERFFKIT